MKLETKQRLGKWWVVGDPEVGGRSIQRLMGSDFCRRCVSEIDAKREKK